MAEKTSTSPTRQMYCSCESKFQDKRYGNGKRLFNFAKKDDSYRCTVCGSKKK